VIAEPLLDLGQVMRVLQVGVRKRGEHVVVQRTQRLRIVDLDPSTMSASPASRDHNDSTFIVALMRLQIAGAQVGRET
jgi:hypothetical protein